MHSGSISVKQSVHSVISKKYLSSLQISSNNLNVYLNVLYIQVPTRSVFSWLVPFLEDLWSYWYKK